MKHSRILCGTAALAALILFLSGCMAQTGGASVPAASASAQPGTSAAANATTEANPSPAASTSEAASTPKTAASNAFKYYKLVDIGMTKDAVDKALGLAPEADTTDEEPEGTTAYFYKDANGDGIFALYDKDLKLTSKTVQYKDPAAALTPYTAKAVTQDEADKITDGMAHADVDKLLGSPGAECSKTLSIIMGQQKIGTVWRWGNADGSFIQVLFVSNDTAMNTLFYDHN